MLNAWKFEIFECLKVSNFECLLIFLRFEHVSTARGPEPGPTLTRVAVRHDIGQPWGRAPDPSQRKAPGPGRPKAQGPTRAALSHYTSESEGRP